MSSNQRPPARPPRSSERPAPPTPSPSDFFSNHPPHADSRSHRGKSTFDDFNTMIASHRVNVPNDLDWSSPSRSNPTAPPPATERPARPTATATERPARSYPPLDRSTREPRRRDEARPSRSTGEDSRRRDYKRERDDDFPPPSRSMRPSPNPRNKHRDDIDEDEYDTPRSRKNNDETRKPKQARKPQTQQPPYMKFVPVVAIVVVLALLFVGAKTLFFSKPAQNFDDCKLVFSSKTLIIGQTGTVEIEGLPTASSTDADTKDTEEIKITWISSDTSVVRVDNGILTAKGEGEATISASINGTVISDTVTVLKTLEGVKSLQILPEKVDILSGKLYPLKFKADIENPEVDATGISPTWSSSNVSIVVIDKDGQITARDVGTATITATLGSQSATCVVTVVKDPASLPADAVEGLDPEDVAAQKDNEKDTTKPDSTTKPDTTKPDSTTQTPATTTPDSTTKPDTTKPDTTKPDSTTQTPDTTTPDTSTPSDTVSSLGISQSFGYLATGESIRLEAYASPSSAAVTWTSSNPSVASVSADGTVKALAPGATTITVKAGGFTQTCELEITAPVVVDDEPVDGKPIPQE